MRIWHAVWERETRQGRGRPARQRNCGSGNQPGKRETTGDQRRSRSADLATDLGAADQTEARETSEAAQARIWQPVWGRETTGDQRGGESVDLATSLGAGDQTGPRETSEAAEARIRQPAWERETRYVHDLVVNDFHTFENGLSHVLEEFIIFENVGHLGFPTWVSLATAALFVGCIAQLEL